MADWNQIAMQSAQALIDTSMAAAQMINENKMQEKQNTYNLNMWKLQNEYNSPSAQMQRYIDAGLNPNLIYSQGTPGNNASAPQINAPDYSKGIDKLQKAFNVIGLQTAFENMRSAKYDADLRKVNSERAFDMYEADKAIGQQYDYNDKTGRFVPHEQTLDAVTVYKYPGQRFYKLNRLAENFNKNYIIPTRENFIDTQRKYLMPQIRMAEYESLYYPYSFWIGNGSRVLNALPLPRFNFKFNKNFY